MQQTFPTLHLKTELPFIDIFAHLIIWLLLFVVTLGLAVFVFPYYMQKLVLNQTYAYDANNLKVGRLHCTIDLASIIGNVIIWTILSILTLGLAYFVFLYKISAHCSNHTRIVPLE